MIEVVAVALVVSVAFVLVGRVASNHEPKTHQHLRGSRVYYMRAGHRG